MEIITAILNDIKEFRASGKEPVFLDLQPFDRSLIRELVVSESRGGKEIETIFGIELSKVMGMASLGIVGPEIHGNRIYRLNNGSIQSIPPTTTSKIKLESLPEKDDSKA